MLTFVMAVYGQPKMLERWWEVLRTYPDELLDELAIIIVDDHGDPPVAIPEDVLGLCQLAVYRVDRQIPWNQMGARNLGMHHAKGWCIMLDPDMVVSPAMARRFLQLTARLKRGTVVRFGLKHRSGRPKIDMTSPNTYLIRSEDFRECGGYDEDYAGNKGWSDVQLLATLKAFFRVMGQPDLWVDFYDTAEIPDAQVRTLDRSVRVNRAMHIRKHTEAKRGGWRRWVQRSKGPNIRFPWTKMV